MDYFLYVTSGGMEAAKLGGVPTVDPSSVNPLSRKKVGKSQREALAAVESGSEDEQGGDE